VLKESKNRGEGYCVEERWAKGLSKKSGLECCRLESYEGPLHCFQLDIAVDTEVSRFCHRARDVAHNPFCSKSSDCPNTEEKQICAHGVTPESQLLMKIVLRNGSFLLFEGHPQVVWSEVLITEYSPRFGAMNFTLFFWLPHMLEKCLRYIVSISGALAILNMAPVFSLDGATTFEVLVRLLFSGTYSRRSRERAVRMIFWSASTLFGANILASLYSLSLAS